MKLLGNKLFILILLMTLTIFAVTVLIQTSNDKDFLYHEEGDDAFGIIDTLD